MHLKAISFFFSFFSDGQIWYGQMFVKWQWSKPIRDIRFWIFLCEDAFGIHTFFYKNHVYKNVEAQITLEFKNVVVILLVAISISFEPQDKI